MTDYEYLFAMSLHNKFREKLVGKNFVGVRDDRLNIKIESNGGLIFEISYPNFAERMLNGLSTEYIVYEVCEKYKKFIINRHFKRETEGEVFE